MATDPGKHLFVLRYTHKVGGRVRVSGGHLSLARSMEKRGFVRVERVKQPAPGWEMVLTDEGERLAKEQL